MFHQPQPAMPEVKDYYKVLEVQPEATPEEIKRAYRKLARQHHPDRHQGKGEAEERFKQIQEAYDTLGDAERRAEYDRMRRNPFGGGNLNDLFGGGRAYRSPDGGFFRMDGGPGAPADEGFGNLGDLFGQFFGGGARSGGAFGGPFGAAPEPPREQRLELQVPFEQALAGGHTEVALPDGSTARIKIPKGVRSGARVRLRPRKQSGGADVHLTFVVAPHPVFSREGDHLTVVHRLTALEAMLGATRVIETAYGENVRLSFPPGTQPGEKFRLRGQGVRTEKGAGDLFVEVQVSVPKDLPAAAREELAQWAARHGLSAA